jgi:hypothetical protein
MSNCLHAVDQRRSALGRRRDVTRYPSVDYLRDEARLFHAAGEFAARNGSGMAGTRSRGVYNDGTEHTCATTSSGI